MKIYKRNLYFFSLMTIVSLLVTSKLYALESKSLDNEVEFSAQENSKSKKKQSAELASDNSYNSQPVVEVTAKAVVKSEADRIYDRRSEEEMKTINRINEQLEKERLEAEKRRSERIRKKLFGEPAAPAATPPAVKPAPQNNSRLRAIENSLSDIKTNLFNQEFDKIEQNSGKYVGLDLGTGKYAVESSPDVITKSAFGISTGMRVEDNPFITLEGHFVLSEHQYATNSNNGSNNYFPQAKQYNAGLALKYDIIPFVITPRLGGTVDYTFRQYSMGSSYRNNSKKLDTHSVDVGLIAGGYIQVSKYLGIEISYRQMMNVSTSAIDSKYRPSGRTDNDTVTILDKSSYGMFMLSIQMGFR